MPSSFIREALGRSLRRIRESQGKTIEKAAADVGVKPKTLSRWEKGECGLKKRLPEQVAELLGADREVLWQEMAFEIGSRIASEIGEDDPPYDPRGRDLGTTIRRKLSTGDLKRLDEGTRENLKENRRMILKRVDEIDQAREDMALELTRLNVRAESFLRHVESVHLRTDGKPA